MHYNTAKDEPVLLSYAYKQSAMFAIMKEYSKRDLPIFFL